MSQGKPSSQMEKAVKSFVCTHPNCGKAFSKSSNLTQHMRIHSGEKPFQCDICGQSFRQTGNLSKHLKGHENAHLRWNRSSRDKPYKCEYENCGKSFTAKSSLQNHMLSHTGQLPYLCQHPNCTERFAKKNIMVAHFSAVHSRPSASNEIEFPLQAIKRKPIRRSDDLVFRCIHSKCRKRFVSESQLRAHLMMHNPGMAAENAFLLNSLQKVMHCVESISSSDQRLKEQLTSSVDYQHVKDEIQRLPFVTQFVANSNESDRSASPVRRWEEADSVATTRSTDISQADHVDLAWAMHRRPLGDSDMDEVGWAELDTLSDSDGLFDLEDSGEENDLDYDSTDRKRDARYSSEDEGEGDGEESEDQYSHGQENTNNNNNNKNRKGERPSGKRQRTSVIPLEVACGFLAEVIMEPSNIGSVQKSDTEWPYI